MTRRFTIRRRQEPRPLLVRARDDQPELFGEFFAERHQAVVAYFARRVLDPETAFDLTAETFASAFAGLPEFRGNTENAVNAWLWTIARNRLLSWRARGAVERQSLQRLGMEVPSMTTLEYERVEELADLDRVRSSIADALEALPEAQHEAVRLRVIHELPYDEIADRLDVTEMVVRARVSRGLRSLAPMLDTLDADVRAAQ